MKISWLVKLAVLFVLVLTWGNGSALASNMRQLIDRDCRICHAKVIDKLIAAGSTHATDVECRDCHLQHPQQDKGLLADCIICHDPQQSDHYSLGSCRDCHHAHWPLELDFAQIETPVKKLCFSCHENPFAAGSSAHADNLRCSECHTSHALSPSCLDCHQGHGQGTVEEPCLSCHAAHNPVPSIPVAGLDGTLCSACHAATSAALSADDGSHAQMACNDCHAQHGQKPDCLQCHEGHSEAMVAADCKSCHAHHRPMPAVFAAEIKTELCASCHEEVSSLFASAGGKHQQNLSCAACHAGHPPAETSILACSSCHAADENSHFALSDCNSCHNPHSPAIEDLGGLENVRPVCLGCHAGVGVAMAEGATAHSEDLSCNQCHETHGESPSCLNCHQGHDEQMQANDCSQCHQPHRPLPVEFLQGTAADLCNGCHEQTVADFNFSGRGHKIALGCIDCHLEHPPADNVIPECATCHDSAENPHFASENCVACHNPHKPVLDDIFTLTDSRPVCAGCHVQVEEQLTAQISAHSETACVGCHRKHAGVPSCLGCHDGHSETMTAADCLTCHQAHAPLLIDFTQKPSSQLCAACHKQQTEAVASAGAGHRDKLNCSACHQVHPAASCADCHSVHPQKGQAIPENCFACHPPSDRPHFAVGDCQEC